MKLKTLVFGVLAVGGVIGIAEGSSFSAISDRFEEAKHHAVFDQVLEEESWPVAMVDASGEQGFDGLHVFSEIIGACEFEFQMICEEDDLEVLIMRIERLAKVSEKLSLGRGYYNELVSAAVREVAVSGLQYALCFDELDHGVFRKLLDRCRSDRFVPKAWLISRLSEFDSLGFTKEEILKVPDGASFSQISWLVERQSSIQSLKSFRWLLANPDLLALGARTESVDFYLRSVLPMSLLYTEKGGDLNELPVSRGEVARRLLSRDLEKYAHPYNGGSANPSDLWRRRDLIGDHVKRKKFVENMFGD